MINNDQLLSIIFGGRSVSEMLDDAVQSLRERSEGRIDTPRLESVTRNGLTSGRMPALTGHGRKREIKVGLDLD